MNSEKIHPLRDASRISKILFYGMLLGKFWGNEAKSNKGEKRLLRNWGFPSKASTLEERFYKNEIVKDLVVLTFQLLNILRYSEEDRDKVKSVEKLNFKCRFDSLTLMCLEERILYNRKTFDLDEHDFPKSGKFIYDFLVDGLEASRRKVLLFVDANNIFEMGYIPTKKVCKALVKAKQWEFRNNIRIVPSKKIRFNQQCLMDRNILLCY